MSNILNIATLIKAAEFIERRDREAEHGYATTLPMPTHFSAYRRKPKIGKIHTKVRHGFSSFKSTHNELEKTRRANLRQHMDDLKNVVPLKLNATRHTTLGLLIDAKEHITKLQKHEKSLKSALEAESKTRQLLRTRLAQLSIVTATTRVLDDHQPVVVAADVMVTESSLQQQTWFQVRTPNSASESSTSTSLSLTSSEHDDMDRMSSAGYCSDSNDSSLVDQARPLTVTFTDTLSRDCVA